MKKFILLCVCFNILSTCYANEEEHLHLKARIEQNYISENVMVYNLSNAKMHTNDCEWAEKCTKNCIYIPKKDLKKMFFVPCSVCGGGVIEPVKFEE